MGATLEDVKHILIVIDDNEEIKAMGSDIASALEGFKVVLKDGADFSPTDLLPADIVFMGAAKAEAPALAELARVLEGINLARRPCGLFSISTGPAIEWLKNICIDSELAVYPEELIQEKISTLKPWVMAVTNYI